MEVGAVKTGSFVEFDGLIGVIVEVPNQTIAEDHVAVWFGLDTQKRISEGGSGDTIPEVWVVPIEYCKPAQSPVYLH